MFRKVLHVTASPQLQENIAQRKVIVYKSRVDPTTLKQTAEGMKNELFIKRFSKPRPEDIHIVSVDKCYEPYVLVDAKYRIDYFTEKVYKIEVADKAEEVKILGESFKPKTVPLPDTEPEQFRKVISIKGQEGIVYEDKTYFILDKTGKEILPDKVPIAPSEDNPKRILKEFGKNTEKMDVSNREVIHIAKSKLIRKPSDVDSVDKEMFQITEYAVIYNPVYEITFRNVKTDEEVTVSVDGVTAEVMK